LILLLALNLSEKEGDHNTKSSHQIERKTMSANKKVQVPIRISKEQHQRFVLISRRTRIPMAVLARDALERLLNENETRDLVNSSPY
jgi:hypothetical protein